MRSSGYRVRLTPQEKAELERLADEAGVTVAEALRKGGREWLLDRQPMLGIRLAPDPDTLLGR